MSYFLSLWWWIWLNFQVRFRVWAPRPRIVPSLPGPVWANGCVSRWRWTDRQTDRRRLVALPGTEHRRSRNWRLCRGGRSQANEPRQQKSKVRSLTHNFPTLAAAAGLTHPEPFCISMISIIKWYRSSNDIDHKLTAVKLAISVVIFLDKNKNTSLAWVIFIAHSQLKTSPPPHRRVETRGHQTCPALFFVLDSRGQFMYGAIIAQ